jgi:NAD(P)-dependent dehydrogenase (short-subunit alcohol dehydrogenase family)
MNRFSNKTALVTGANSGLGFEAAAQLAETGFGRVILACRSEEKARDARRRLVERVGRDPFETLVVDVASVASANAASDELLRRGHAIDALLLNAGMVSGEEMHKTEDGLELTFASSVIGHHVMTDRLLEAGLLAKGGRVVLAGSEAANNDLPAMMDAKLYDFATGAPTEFGADLRGAMINFARGEGPNRFHPMRHYAVTKAFSAWWSAAMARRHGDNVAFFTVSPGANMGTNGARHFTGFKRFLFTKFMPTVGGFLGMNMPTSEGAKRYVDVLLDEAGVFENGRTYTSRPKRMVGPLHAVDYEHLLDEERQELALDVLGHLTRSRSRLALAS